MASLTEDNTYYYDESQSFVSRKTRLDAMLNTMNSNLQANDVADLAQAASILSNTEAIQENQELDAAQAELISANTASIQGITAQIGAEANRALDAETAIASGLTDEIARAKTAEEGIKAWVEEQGYVTEVQDLSSYATLENVEAAKQEAISSATQDLTDYALKTEIPSLEGYVTNVSLATTLVDYAKNSDAANSHGELELMLTNVSNEAKGLTTVVDIVLNKVKALEEVHSEIPTSIVALNENLEGDYTPTDGKLYMVNSTVSGERIGTNNAKVLIDAANTTIDNVVVTTNASNPIFNVFEQKQTVESVCSEFNASNVTVAEPLLKHNVFNLYNLTDNAVINIKDCRFNLDVENTNMLRVSNYQNASNVVINLENIEWTYEDADSAATSTSWPWAGLIVFQSAGSDASVTGDTQYIDTWTVNVKNCRYNGELVNDVNWGQHNQVLYFYNVGGTRAVSLESIQINFYDENGNEI